MLKKNQASQFNYGKFEFKFGLLINVVKEPRTFQFNMGKTIKHFISYLMARWNFCQEFVSKNSSIL